MHAQAVEATVARQRPRVGRPDFAFPVGAYPTRGLDGVRLASVQRSAGNRAALALVQRMSVQRDRTGAADPGANEAKRFLSRYFVGEGYQRRRNVEGIAAGLKERIRGQQYALVKAVMAELESGIEDDVAAATMKLVLDVDLERAAEDGAGKAMLDVLYEALMTGTVEDAERKEGNRILVAKRSGQSQSAFLDTMKQRMIFPIRNIGLRFASATFKATRESDGRIKVRYTSVKVSEYKMFADDLATLGGWSAVRDGLFLDPEQVVAVRLYDEDGGKTPMDIPALALIDFGQQIQDKTISTAATAFFLGLTLGMGALGGGAIRGLQVRVAAGEPAKAALWAMRGVIWADRVAYGVQAGAMFINGQRDWILRTWPDGGREVLDAVDSANRIAAFYGSWGRLTAESLMALGRRAIAASNAWKAATARRVPTDPKDKRLVNAIDDEIDLLAAELAHAQQLAAKRPAPAAPKGAGGFGRAPRVVEPKRQLRGSTGDAYEHIVRDSGGSIRLKRNGHSIVCQRCADEISWSAGVEKDYRRELRNPEAAGYKTRLDQLKVREAATPVSDTAARAALADDFTMLGLELDQFRLRSRLLAGGLLRPNEVDDLIRIAGGDVAVVQGLLHVSRNDPRKVRALLAWSAGRGSPANRIWQLAKKFEKRAVAEKVPLVSTRLKPYATEANFSHFLEAHHFTYFDPRLIPARPAGATTMWSVSTTKDQLEGFLFEAVEVLKSKHWPVPRLGTQGAETVVLKNGVHVRFGVHQDGYIGQFYPLSGPEKLVDQVVWDELVEVFEVLFTRPPR